MFQKKGSTFFLYSFPVCCFVFVFLLFLQHLRHLFFYQVLSFLFFKKKKERNPHFFLFIYNVIYLLLFNFCFFWFPLKWMFFNLLLYFLTASSHRQKKMKIKVQCRSEIQINTFRHFDLLENQSKRNASLTEIPISASDRNDV